MAEKFKAFDASGDDASVAERWRRWVRSFVIFAGSKGITERTTLKFKLLHEAGEEVQAIWYTLPESEEADRPLTSQEKDEVSLQHDPFKECLEALNKYFEGKASYIYVRYNFRKMEMLPQETVQQFTTRLKGESVNCGFNDYSEEKAILDQIVTKCRSSELRTKLLEKGDALTLQMAREIARSLETSQQQASQMEGLEESVAKLRLNSEKKREDRFKGRNPDLKCFRCGSSGHLARDEDCPARGRECNNCHREGHFAACCKSRGKQDEQNKTTGKYDTDKKFRKKVKSKVRQLDTDDDSDEDEDQWEYSYSVTCFGVNSSGDDAMLQAKVGGVNLKLMIDSGASCNIIDQDSWEECKRRQISGICLKTNKKIFAYACEKPLEVLGKFSTTVVLSNGNSCSTYFYVVAGKGMPILGKNTALKLSVLQLGLQSKVQSLKTETQDHCSKLEEYKGKYPAVFKGIGKLKDYELKLRIRTDVQPVAQPARRIPYQLRKKLDEKMKIWVQDGIIEKVNDATPWVSPLVLSTKKSGELRPCVDMRQANTAIVRERQPIPAFEDDVAAMHGSTVWSVVDLKSAFLQVELDQDSREITTFATHSGNYRFKRLFFGISCAPEIFQRILMDVVQECQGVRVYIDDLIVFGKNNVEHDQHLEKLFRTLDEKGLTLNPDKCVIGQSEVTYRGHRFSKDGVRPLDDRIKSIMECRAPKNRAELESFLGLVGYNSRFIPDYSTLTHPLRKLTKKGVTYDWKQEQDKAFKRLKKRLANASGLSYYSSGAETFIVTDASPYGLGAVLVQTTSEGPRVIEYASRALTDPETKYGAVEKEALALVWACERFQFYVYGGPFTLITDHRPLEFIFSKRSKPCARVERWVLRLQGFDYTVLYRPGKTNIADPLSRLLPKNLTPPVHGHDDLYVKWIAQQAVPRAMTIAEVQEESRTDPELQLLRQSISQGSWPAELKRYEIIKYELCVLGDLVLRGTRLILPSSLRKTALELAHEGHPGIVKMKHHLRSKVWWPEVDKQAEQFVRRCHGCQLVGNPDPCEPITRTELPTRPWQHLAIDFLGPVDENYLLVAVDYYSRFVEVVVMKKITTARVIPILTEMFARHGIPISIKCDNGPQFISEAWEGFLKENGIKLQHTTPLWPQANGEIERQNRGLLKSMRIAHAEGRNWKEELHKYLLMYRATPHTVTGVSPAELLFNRTIRTKLPEVQDPINDEEVRDRDRERKARGKTYSDAKRRARESEIQVGDAVLLQQKPTHKLMPRFEAEPYQVLDKVGNSVVIVSPTGVRYRRNSSMLKRFHTPALPQLDLPDLPATGTEPNPTPNTADEVPVEPRRSGREIKVPEKLKDFVLS